MYVRQLSVSLWRKLVAPNCRSRLNLKNSMKIFTESQVRRFLQSRVGDVIRVNKEAFVAVAQERAVVPSRIGLPYKQDWTLIKPSCLPDTAMGLKIVSVRSDNPTKGLPTVPATVMLLEPETGLPRALMAATYLTGLRTATGPALSVELCTPTEVDELVIFGAGLQAATHLRTMLHVRPSLKRISIINRTRKRAEKLIEESGDILGSRKVQILESRDAESILSILQKADIICTCTHSATPVFSGNATLKESCHITAVGSYTPEKREVPLETVKACSAVIVDTPEAWDVGDVKDVVDFVSEKIILGKAILEPQDKWRSQRTLFKSVGTAIQDVMTGTFVLENCHDDDCRSIDLLDE